MALWPLSFCSWQSPLRTRLSRSLRNSLCCADQTSPLDSLTLKIMLRRSRGRCPGAISHAARFGACRLGRHSGACCGLVQRTCPIVAKRVERCRNAAVPTWKSVGRLSGTGKLLRYGSRHSRVSGTAFDTSCCMFRPSLQMCVQGLEWRHRLRRNDFRVRSRKGRLPGSLRLSGYVRGLRAQEAVR